MKIQTLIKINGMRTSLTPLVSLHPGTEQQVVELVIENLRAAVVEQDSRSARIEVGTGGNGKSHPFHIEISIGTWPDEMA